MNAVLLWMTFIFGQFVYMLKRAHFAASPAGGSKVPRVRDYFRIYAVPLFLRAVAGAVLFWTFAFYPDLFTKLVDITGVQVNWNIPLVPPVTLGLGIASDAVLDFLATKIPWLKDQIPTV